MTVTLHEALSPEMNGQGIPERGILNRGIPRGNPNRRILSWPLDHVGDSKANPPKLRHNPVRQALTP
jgi:hypothetical protein